MGVIGNEAFTSGLHTWKIRIDQLQGSSMIYFGLNDLQTNPVTLSKLSLLIQLDCELKRGKDNRNLHIKKHLRQP